MKLPVFVKNVIRACARDIVDAIKISGQVKELPFWFKDQLEDTIYSGVSPIFWGVKTATDDTNIKDIISKWVAKNATKEMYEKFVGADKSLTNLLGNMYINDPEKLRVNFPNLFSELVGSTTELEKKEVMEKEEISKEEPEIEDELAASEEAMKLTEMGKTKGIEEKIEEKTEEKTVEKEPKDKRKIVEVKKDLSVFDQK